MINKEVYTYDYIMKVKTKYKADPQIIEKTIFAFGLLEALSNSGASFIFKGGTSLMLLLDKPLRLSTDIDITVDPEYDILSFIQKASKIYPFIRYEESTRLGSNSIVKKHFKFYYKSIIYNDKETTILLDVLFENNHYTRLLKKEIKTEFIETNGEKSYVMVPSPDSLIGDKLTAFAPHTIGVKPQYIRSDGKIIDKRIETIKQFFDIASLYDKIHDFNEIVDTYKNTSKSEIGYRGLNITYKDCLIDTFNASLSILSRGKKYPEDYSNYLYGIRGIGSYLINIRFNAETSYVQASKIMYLVACILTEYDFKNDILDMKLFTDQYAFINTIRKLDINSFNMAAKAIELIKTII